VLPAVGGFVATPAGGYQTFASGAQVIAARWRGNSTYIYYARVSGEWRLYSQPIGQAAQLIIGGLPEGIGFDVR
jgi:hypothetical protein